MEFKLRICSIFDSCTGWVELATIISASSKKSAELWENGFIVNQGNLLVATVKNSQANHLAERMHLALANQLSVRVFEEDTWVEDTQGCKNYPGVTDLDE